MEENRQLTEEQYQKQLNDQQINRRNKLATYKELNINPFGQAYKTNATCLELKKKYKKLKKEEVDESKIKRLEINKDLVFSNNAEILAKNIFEKIMANAFIIVNLKNIYKSVDTTCSNYLIN